MKPPLPRIALDTRPANPANSRENRLTTKTKISSDGQDPRGQRETRSCRSHESRNSLSVLWLSLILNRVSTSDVRLEIALKSARLLQSTSNSIGSTGSQANPGPSGRALSVLLAAVQNCLLHFLSVAQRLHFNRFFSTRQYAYSANIRLNPCRRLGARVVYDEGLAGLVVRKDEAANDTDAVTKADKILKLCTFKVRPEKRGVKLGELLLKQVFWFAQSNKYDLVYLSTYSEQEALTDLLEYYGFMHTAPREVRQPSFRAARFLLHLQLTFKKNPACRRAGTPGRQGGPRRLA